jgi:hypothetical protein
MLVVTGNLRKLQKFRDEMIEGTAAFRDARDAAKLNTRKKRREQDTRVAPWDNFAEKNKQEDLEAAQKLAAAEKESPPTK